MKAIRKQHKVMQVRFNQISDADGKLTITGEPRLIRNSENLFFDTIFRLWVDDIENTNRSLSLR